MNSLELRKVVCKAIESRVPALVESLGTLPYFYGKYSTGYSKQEKAQLHLDDFVLKALDAHDPTEADDLILSMDKAYLETELVSLLDTLEVDITKAAAAGADIAEVLEQFTKGQLQAFLGEKFLFMKNRAVLKSIVDRDAIYKSFGGGSCFVSLLPYTECAEAYTAEGTPRVFTAASLLTTPSLLSKGTVVPVPPGYMWQGRKLVCVSDSLLKAGGIGEPSKLSNEGRKAAASQERSNMNKNPASTPGQPSVAQTGNVAGQPGISNPKGSGTGGDGKEYWYLPLDKANGQPVGAEKSKSGQSWKIPKGQSAKFADGTEIGEEQGHDEETENHREQAVVSATVPTTPEGAAVWTKVGKPKEVVMAHMASGKIAQAKKLEAAAAGINASYRCVIAGNGRGLLKPSIKFNYAETNHYTAGKTAIPSGEGHIREAAAYQIATAFGLGDHIPPTETRVTSTDEYLTGADKPEQPEQVHTSMQQWQEGYSSAGSKMVSLRGGDPKKQSVSNLYMYLMADAPEDKREQLKAKMTEMVTLQLMMGNNDFHGDNLIVSEDFSDIKSIDNSLTSGYGMEAVRNDWFRGMHNAGESLKIPDHLMERFKNTTFSDMKRASKGLSDEAVAHNFLRMKYMAHLQEAEGELDYNKFRFSIVGSPDHGIHPDMAGLGYDDVAVGYLRNLDNGTLANQLFEGFAKKWIEDNLPKKKLLGKTKTTPHSADAEAILAIGPLRNVEASHKDPEAYRAAGKHLDYYKSIRPVDPVEKLPISQREGFGKDSHLTPQRATNDTPTEEQRFHVNERNAVVAQLQQLVGRAAQDAKVSPAPTRAPQGIADIRQRLQARRDAQAATPAQKPPTRLDPVVRDAIHARLSTLSANSSTGGA